MTTINGLTTTPLEAIRLARSNVDRPRLDWPGPHGWAYRVRYGSDWRWRGVGAYAATMQAMRVETARRAAARYLDVSGCDVTVYDRDRRGLPRRVRDIVDALVKMTVCRRVEMVVAGIEDGSVLGLTFDGRFDGDDLYEIVDEAECDGLRRVDHDRHIEVADCLDGITQRRYLLAMIRRGGHVTWELHERVGDHLSDLEWHAFVDQLVDDPRVRRASAWTE